MLERIRYYFADELWNFPLSTVKGFRAIYVKWLRIIYLSLRGFFQSKGTMAASSLTYYSMMSIVPVIAMAFAISRGFGYHEVFKKQILVRFQDQNEAFTALFKYADAFLEQAKGGVIAGVGFVILFLTVVLLMNNLENILNNIWGVKKHRSWRRVFSDYFALMLIGPILFVIASSASVFVVNQFEVGINALKISVWASSWLIFLANLLPYCLFWILFTFFYLFMPNTKVQFSSAFLGGLIAGSLYLAFQIGYIYFQVLLSRYGAVYGSMAALPLFLIWIKASWIILLLGAQIAYAHQTLEEHEFEGRASKISHSFKQLLTLWILHLVIKKGFITREALIKGYQVPFAVVNPILEDLVDSQIIHEARGGYVPSSQSEEMRVVDVIHLLESNGESDFPFIEARSLAPFEKTLEQFSKIIESSPANIRLSHVSNSI